MEMETTKYLENIVGKLNKGVVIYNTYDSGKFEDITEETTTTLDATVSQLLLYPTADSYLKINGSEKQIYLPSNSWTPISIATKVFSVTPVAGSTTIHWQGWVL